MSTNMKIELANFILTSIKDALLTKYTQLPPDLQVCNIKVSRFDPLTVKVIVRPIDGSSRFFSIKVSEHH